MWIMAKSILGDFMFINAANVAVFKDAGNKATVVILRDGSEFVIDMDVNDIVVNMTTQHPDLILA